MSTHIIEDGTRAVVINVQGAKVWANLYVNAQRGIKSADITLQRWTGKTLKGAERWAKRVLASAPKLRACTIDDNE